MAVAFSEKKLREFHPLTRRPETGITQLRSEIPRHAGRRAKGALQFEASLEAVSSTVAVRHVGQIVHPEFPLFLLPFMVWAT
jgi:hypothetical protein